VTNHLNNNEDQVFFDVGASLRKRDERLSHGVERIAGGEDAAMVAETLGSLDDEDAGAFEEMRALGAPMSEDFLATLGDVAIRESKGVQTMGSSAASNVVSLATWRTRSWGAGGGVVAVAASLALLFIAGDDEEAWSAHYNIQLVNAPESARGVGDEKVQESSPTQLSIASSGLAEWVLRPTDVVESTPAFGAFLVNNEMESISYVDEPCVKHQISGSGSVHVEINLAACPWVIPGGSYELQFVVGPRGTVEQKWSGERGAEGMSMMSVKLDVNED